MTRLSAATLLETTDRLSRGVAVALAAALLVIVAVVDALSGPDLSLVIFYLLPVVLMAWRLGMRAGLLTAVVAAATGFVVATVERDLNLAILTWNALARAGFYLFTAWLVAEVHLLLDEERQRAAVDPLTGLLNRRAFALEARRSFAEAARASEPVALLYFDLDGLKAVNDSFGHEAGDTLLTEFTTVVSRELRAGDLFVRLGGDEFAVLTTGADPEQVGAIADRLLAALASDDGGIATSIGIAVSATAPDDVEPLLQAADRTMYEAKQAGGRRYRLVDLSP